MLRKRDLTRTSNCRCFWERDKHTLRLTWQNLICSILQQSLFPKRLLKNQQNNWWGKKNIHVSSKKEVNLFKLPLKVVQVAASGALKGKDRGWVGLFSSPTELGRLPTHRPTSSNPKNAGSIPSKKQPHCNALKWGFEGESVSYARSRRSKYSLSSDVSPMQTHSTVKISLTQT